MLRAVSTLPLAHPDTEQILTFTVICETEAAGVEYSPATLTRSVRPTRFSVPAGIVQAIKFWSVETFAVTVTGVTFVHCQAPVGELVPLLLLFQLGVCVPESPNKPSQVAPGADGGLISFSTISPLVPSEIRELASGVVEL